MFQHVATRLQDLEEMINRVDLGRRSDLGLHCLLLPNCPKRKEFYGICDEAQVPPLLHQLWSLQYIAELFLPELRKDTVKLTQIKK